MSKIMIAYRVETLDGSVYKGSVAVNADNADAACRCVVGLIRGGYDHKYSRPDCFNDFDPREVDDISVTCLGPA